MCNVGSLLENVGVKKKRGKKAISIRQLYVNVLRKRSLLVVRAKGTCPKCNKIFVRSAVMQ